MPANPNVAGAKGPQVKITVTHTAPSVHQAAQGAANAVSPRSVAGKGGGRQPSQSAGQRFSPLALGSPSPQMVALANRITKQSTNAALVPLRQQAGQISNTQGTVANRYAGYTNTADQILQGLGQNAQQGALSNDNVVAQQAQNTANEIDKTGAAAQALNAGYLDPNVAAALQNQRQFSGTVGGAQAGLVGSQGANETNFMGNLRGTAALQGLEGQQAIASDYAKQLGANRAQQQSLILKEQPTAKALAATLCQQQFTNYATLRSINTKAAQQEANSIYDAARAKAGLLTAGATATNAQTKAFQAHAEAQYQQGELALGQGKLTVAAQNNQANEAIKQIDAKIAQGRLTEQQRHDLANERIAWQRVLSAKTGGSATQVKGANAIIGEAGYYAHAIAGGKTPVQASGGVAQALRNDGYEGQAAIELATQGYIGPKVVAGLKQQGVSVPKAWTTRPKGWTPPKAPKPAA